MRDEQIGSLGALQYDLRSDNIEDKSIVSILSRLRYGKGIDEISDSQKRTLLQDPVVELAGLSISNAFIDPIISPIENKIRQLFRLDYFFLQTDIIQNIFARYYNDKNPTDDLILTEEQEKISKTGNERVLLVDDEEPIARLEKQMLERLGYRVECSLSSVDALDTFMTKPNEFDLVITDMTMPALTGDQLAKKLISIRHDIPVIICTGFSDRINKSRAIDMGIKGFLMKPLLKSEMAQMIRKVLDKKTINPNGTIHI